MPFATVMAMDVNEALAEVGVRVPDVLIPRSGIDLQAWAVVACDQFTSQPEYWQQVEQIVGEAPSTLRLTFPEVYLEDPDPDSRIAAINQAMAAYLGAGLLDQHAQTMVLVRRETRHGVVRWGLMVALDLEQYSWQPDARTLIRATEGTILDRLPPRVAIRQRNKRPSEMQLKMPQMVFFCFVNSAHSARRNPIPSAPARSRWRPAQCSCVRCGWSAACRRHRKRQRWSLCPASM